MAGDHDDPRKVPPADRSNVFHDANTDELVEAGRFVVGIDEEDIETLDEIHGAQSESVGR